MDHITSINHKDEYDETVSIEYSLKFKVQGNEFHKRGLFREAIDKFTNAIDLDPNNAAFYCNRSMCYAAVGDLENSVLDARVAIDKRPTEAYVKAYFYLVKGLMDLKLYREARSSLLVALNRTGSNKELNILEDQLVTMFGGHPIRPRPNDFDIMDDLGDGNFTKVFKAKYKKTGYVYAIKTIEKTTVERMKRRHPNIHNEILMEKRVLSKLDHPSIVILYATFQDAYSLYYQMEFCAGGELWTYIKDDNGGMPVSVGCHESIVKFAMVEAINVVEYMHRKGIVHRDIKLENIMITSSGHIKFVDFGTAKDLLETDLNGPEFVGTAEYMSPYTVRSRPVGIDADLWALGVLFFQLQVGYTPFAASSPYLSFLRIQRGVIKIPKCVLTQARSLLSHLLTIDAWDRIHNASGQMLPRDSSIIDDSSKQSTTHKKHHPVMTQDFLSSLSYDNLRQHSYFDSMVSDHQDERNLYLSTIHQQAAVVVPKLKEYCLRAVGRACCIVAEQIAKNGGIKPAVPWLQRFDLMRLSDEDRNTISHYLERCDRLNPVNGVYRLFFTSNMDTRCLQADRHTREYLRHSYAHHGQYSTMFSCVHINASPSFSDPQSHDVVLKSTITAINRLRPKFLIVGGSFTASKFGEVNFQDEVASFRKQVSRISESIPVLFIPGEYVMGGIPTPACIAYYHSCFGSDYYGFWYSGTRILVVNSSLLIHDELAPAEAKAQDMWFEEEIEQAKLCAAHVIILSHHPWFLENAEDKDDIGLIPTHIRSKWMHRLRHKKIKFMFASHMDNHFGKAFIRPDNITADANVSAENFIIEDEDVPGNNKVDMNGYPVHEVTGEPLKPSEIMLEEKKKQVNNDTQESDDDKELANEDLDYYGPFSVTTASINPLESSSAASTIDGSIRIIRVYEDDIKHQVYDTSNMPASIII